MAKKSSKKNPVKKFNDALAYYIKSSLKFAHHHDSRKSKSLMNHSLKLARHADSMERGA